MFHLSDFDETSDDARGMTMLILFLQMVAINVALGDGIEVYSPAIGFGSFVLSLLGSHLPAGIGAFFSLRAATVRSVQQMLGSAAFLLLLIPLVGARVLPALGIRVSQLDLTCTLVYVVTTLVVADVILIHAAMCCSPRTRLILD